jgi:hypothetical protein
VIAGQDQRAATAPSTVDALEAAVVRAPVSLDARECALFADRSHHEESTVPRAHKRSRAGWGLSAEASR